MISARRVVSLEKIPQRLKDERHWVTWKYEMRSGKLTKVLYQQDGRRARSNDPATWMTFEEACRTARDNNLYDGIGVVLSPPYFGIDLDSCITPEGQLTSWARRVLDACPSYCEVSPSGFGLKLIGLGELPMPMHKSDGTLRCGRVYKQDLEPATADKKPELAIWRRRFFTITGDVFDGRSTVEECPKVGDLFASLFSREQTPKAQSTATPDERSERVKAAIAAMNKVSLPCGENDGSARLIAYARQAKRFIVDSEDALRAIRAMELLHPFPVQLSDQAILKRYSDADVVAGEDFTPRSSADSYANMTVNGQGSSAPQPVQSRLQIVPARDLCAQFKSLREPLIHGLLRRGETMNIIAPPKFGKSWLVLALAISVALGLEWLGFLTKACRVLLIDNELHEETLSDRLMRVCKAMGLSEIPETLDTVELRGKGQNINELALELTPDVAGKYGLIILDALYRFLPEKTNENANGDMTQVYNTIDGIARRTGAAIAVIHHSSKGDQSTKDSVDVGAGAGAITRATDSHLTLRTHELDSCAVLELNARSWPPMEPATIHFEFPLWQMKHIAPALKQRQLPSAVKQKNQDAETDARLLAVLKGTKGLTKPELRGRTGYGDPRITRSLVRLSDAGSVTPKRGRSKKNKKVIERWICTEICTPICTNESTDK